MAPKTASEMESKTESRMSHASPRVEGPLSDRRGGTGARVGGNKKPRRRKRRGLYYDNLVRMPGTDGGRRGAGNAAHQQGTQARALLGVERLGNALLLAPLGRVRLGVT